MTITNHQNDLSCAFADTLIAVLYDEATTAERYEFRKHFGGCAICREELSSFGKIRNDVSEWRAIDFESLKTPAIILPDVEKTPATTLPLKISWIHRASKFLSLSGGQLRGAGAFAAFVICVALTAMFGYALVNRIVVQELAEIPDIKRTKPGLSSPTPTPVPQLTPTLQTDSIQTVKNLSNGTSITSKSAQTVVKSPVHQEKSADAARSYQQQRQQVKRGNTRNRSVSIESKSAELAIETVDDLEDNSLRLSDLLDDLTPSL